MFTKINFLFLLSLAFMSWAVLCLLAYLHIHRGELDAHFQQSRVHSSFKSDSQSKRKMDNDDNQLPFGMTVSKLDFVLNVGTAISCIFLLYQIGKLLEKFISYCISKNYNIYSENSTRNMDHIHRERELLMKVTQLQRDCYHLEQSLNDLIRQESCQQKCTNNLENVMGALDACLKNAPHNTFISNKHIHIDQPVIVKSSDVFHTNATGSGKYDTTEVRAKGDVRANIWAKYLGMKNIGIMSGLSASLKYLPAINDENQTKDNHRVVSTEEMLELINK